MKNVLRFAVIIVMLQALVTGHAWAQDAPLMLDRAVAIALEKNPLRKAVLAETRVAKAGTREARAGLLPRITFTESAVRSNDPVFAFGTKLRQQRFTMADFELNSLNRPHPVSDISSRFSGQWTIFDSRQSWFALSRARLMAEATSHQLERADQELIFRVVQVYYGVLLAARQLAVAEQSLKTALSIEQTSRNRVESGLAVESDLLTAQVQSASRKQQEIRARNDLAMARAELAITLGMPADSSFSLTDALPEELPQLEVAAELERCALRERPDLKRVLTEQGAQEKAVAMARAAFGPRVNTFASWQTNSRSLGWNGGNSWTAGVEVQIDLFAGGAKLAQLSRERATQERVVAMRQAAEDGVRLEVRRAYYDADAARQQVEVARAATLQADESLRIQQNRYEAGLATVTDLLRVEEAAHRAKSDYTGALYRAITSRTSLELATGMLTQDSRVVKP